MGFFSFGSKRKPNRSTNRQSAVRAMTRSAPPREHVEWVDTPSFMDSVIRRPNYQTGFGDLSVPTEPAPLGPPEPRPVKARPPMEGVEVVELAADDEAVWRLLARGLPIPTEPLD